MFQIGTLSFQVSQPIRSSKDKLVSTDIIKCVLGKIGDRYSFIKKPDSQVEKKNSTESFINEVIEIIMADENEPYTQHLLHNVSHEDGLMKLFGQFSSLMSPVSE